tara:strand:- start:109 stop:1242 length:1134 start_codon:yes stop_codon:yes gene_type:complete
MNFILNLFFVLETANVGYFNLFIFANLLILFNLFLQNECSKINLGIFISLILFIIPFIFYFYGINSTSILNDLSSITIISLVASNFVRNKLINNLKNIEIILSSIFLAGIIGIFFSQGNMNYQATTISIPFLVILLREKFLLNGYFKEILNKYYLIIIFIFLYFIFSADSTLNIIISIATILIYFFDKIILRISERKFSKISISYFSFLFSSIIAFISPLLLYIDSFNRLLRNGWNKTYDIRYLIDLATFREFLDSKKLIFGNGIFNNSNKGDFFYYLNDLTLITRDRSSHNLFSEFLYRNGFLGIIILIFLTALFFTPIKKENRLFENFVKTIIFLAIISSIFLVYNIFYSESWTVLYSILLSCIYFRLNNKIPNL